MMTIGTDIIKVEKIKQVKHLDRIYTKNELTYFETHQSIETKAGMYAAKEALLKSLKYGLEGASFLNIEIIHTNYVPSFVFYGDLKKEIDKKHYCFDLSISHDGDYAIATVICYQED